MSLISHYRFDEATATLGEDSQGSRDMTNTGVVSATGTYGDCAYFDGSSYLNLGESSVHASMKDRESRSFSCWFNSAGGGGIHSNGIGNSNNRRYKARVSSTGTLVMDYRGSTINGSTTTVDGTWHLYVSTFEESSNSGTLYLDGASEGTRGSLFLDTYDSDFSIGRDPDTGGSLYTGYLSDFRHFSGVLTSTQIANLYANGPLDAFLPSISATMYTHLADISWNPLSGATNYTVTQTENSGTEDTIVSETTGLSFTSKEINPGSSYEFKLYSDLDAVTAAVTTTESAPAISNSTVSALAVRVENDFTEISRTAFDEIDLTLVDVLSTGDEVTIHSGDAVFIEDSGTLEATGKNVLTPFLQDGGTGQQITITSSTGDSDVLTYDETNNQITKDSTTYSVGDYFLLGGYKARITEE